MISTSATRQSSRMSSLPGSASALLLLLLVRCSHRVAVEACRWFEFTILRATTSQMPGCRETAGIRALRNSFHTIASSSSCYPMSPMHFLRWSGSALGVRRSVGGTGLYLISPSLTSSSPRFIAIPLRKPTTHHHRSMPARSRSIRLPMHLIYSSVRGSRSALALPRRPIVCTTASKDDNEGWRRILISNSVSCLSGP